MFIQLYMASGQSNVSVSEVLFRDVETLRLYNVYYWLIRGRDEQFQVVYCV